MQSPWHRVTNLSYRNKQNHWFYPKLLNLLNSIFEEEQHSRDRLIGLLYSGLFLLQCEMPKHDKVIGKHVINVIICVQMLLVQWNEEVRTKSHTPPSEISVYSNAKVLFSPFIILPLVLFSTSYFMSISLHTRKIHFLDLASRVVLLSVTEQEEYYCHHCISNYTVPAHLGNQKKMCRKQ